MPFKEKTLNKSFLPVDNFSSRWKDGDERERDQKLLPINYARNFNFWSKWCHTWEWLESFNLLADPLTRIPQVFHLVEVKATQKPGNLNKWHHYCSQKGSATAFPFRFLPPTTSTWFSAQNPQLSSASCHLPCPSVGVDCSNILEGLGLINWWSYHIID